MFKFLAAKCYVETHASFSDSKAGKRTVMGTHYSYKNSV